MVSHGPGKGRISQAAFVRSGFVISALAGALLGIGHSASSGILRGIGELVPTPKAEVVTRMATNEARAQVHRSPGASGHKRPSTPPATGMTKLAALPDERDPNRVLVVLEDSLPTTVSPLNPGMLIDYRVAELIHDSPFTMDDAGHFRHSLIASDAMGQPRFSTAPDGIHVTAALSKARFHNGLEITVDDLRSTFEGYAQAAEEGRLSSTFYHNLTAGLSGQKPNPQKNFLFSFKSARKESKSAFTLKLLPKQGFSHPEDPTTWPSDAKYANKAIGAGPFAMMGELKENNTRLRLQAFPDYHKGKPQLSGIDISAQPAQGDKINAFLTGHGDVIVSINKSNQDLVSQSGATVIPYYVRNWWYLGFNHRDAALKMLPVRQAILCAIDREELARQLADRVEYFGGQGDDGTRLRAPLPGGDGLSSSRDASIKLISGPFVPESRYYNRSVRHVKPNFKKAVALMSDIKGMQYDSKMNKWLYGGSVLRFNLVIRKDMPNSRDVAELLVQQLADFGISVRLQELTPEMWRRELGRERGRNRYQLFLGQWNFDQNDDIRPIFGTEGAMNNIGYSNAAVDDLFRRFEDSGKYEIQVGLMKEAHELLSRDLPCIFLWEASQVAAFAPAVHGYRIHHLSFYVNPHRWRLQRGGLSRDER